MPVVLPQAANKVMILCAGGTKIMKLCLSELEPSSVFGLRMKNALNRQSGSCVLTWACHEAILLKNIRLLILNMFLFYGRPLSGLFRLRVAPEYWFCMMQILYVISQLR